MTLLDAEGAAVASHEFQPEEYLADKARSGLGMTPHAFLPLSLEIEDPGLKAVGFEQQFRKANVIGLQVLKSKFCLGATQPDDK